MTDATTTTTFGNAVEDVLEVHWAPSAVFERSRDRGFGKHLLLVVLIALAVVVATKGLIEPWLDGTTDLQLQMMAKEGKAPPAEAANAMRQFGSIGFYATPLVLTIAAFLSGLLLMLSGKLLQAPLRFGQGVLIATLATMPRLIGFVLSAILALFSDAQNARSLYDLSMGPMRFLDPLTMSPVLVQLLSGIDLFSLWQLVLFGIGVSAMARVTTSTGFIAGLLAWVLGTAIPLVFALLR
jgi:hypothetical protein